MFIGEYIFIFRMTSFTVIPTASRSQSEKVKADVKKNIRQLQADNKDILKVINAIRKNVLLHISKLEKTYIECKYIKYCAEDWIKESSVVIGELNDHMFEQNITTLISDLNNTQSLETVPRLLRQQMCYLRLKKPCSKLIFVKFILVPSFTEGSTSG